MKTGTLILAMHSSEAEMMVAERVREHLLSKGRKNVFIGCHHGEPDCYGVFLEMNRQGIDTYCILPLTVAEGNQTIWHMPKHLTLPDNSGSWTMIGEHDVATRFSTAVGREPSIGTAIGNDLGTPDPSKGIIVCAYGSKLSLSEKTAEYYAEYLRYLGWRCLTAFTNNGPRSMKDAGKELATMGCASIHIVPLFITTEGGSFSRALSELGLPYSVGRAVSEYPEFYEALDSKVPEDW